MSETTDPWAADATIVRFFEPRRSELLAEAIDKPVKAFRQWDIWVPVKNYELDDITGTPDGTCPGITGPGDLTWELRNGTPVRVQAEPHISREDVIKALRSLADSIERQDWSWSAHPEPDPF